MVQTKIYKIGPGTQKDAFETMIHKTAEALLNGKTAAFPTETVYGIGASIFNENAVLKIYQIKGRPPDKPLSVLIGSAKDMDKAASEIPDFARLLAEKFWPGPLTMILRKKEEISDKVTAGKGTVGLRVPAPRAAGIGAADGAAGLSERQPVRRRRAEIRRRCSKRPERKN